MLNDPQIVFGLLFLATLLMIINIFWAREIFREEPYFQLGFVIGEISFIILVVTNPEWLRTISFIFALMIVALTFLSGLMLSERTIILGLPSMLFFGYSLLFGRDELWVAVVSSLIFALGLVLTLRETQPVFEMLGELFPVFAFSLAIVGVFLIPRVFPQIDFFNGIAEIAGTVAGLIMYLYAVVRIRG